jgi:hypothetical protein
VGQSNALAEGMHQQTCLLVAGVQGINSGKARDWAVGAEMRPTWKGQGPSPGKSCLSLARDWAIIGQALWDWYKIALRGALQTFGDPTNVIRIGASAEFR